MKLKIINHDEYLKFALDNKYVSIYQLPEWGMLKAGTGWKSHLMGFYDKDKLVGETLLLEKKGPFGLSLFYAPRGFLLDVNNIDLLTEFTKQLKKYIKDNHGFMLKVDPNVIYATYDENGENKNIVNNEALINFKKLNYKHLGFTKNFETMQPRFLCRFKLQENYGATLSSFSKTTRKNIEKTEKMGIRTREIDIDEIDLFVFLLQETGNLKNFIVRPASYYKRMYELMPSYVKLYISYIDTNLHYKYLVDEIASVKKELVDIDNKMKSGHVGNKLNTLKSQNEQKIKRLDKELIDAKKMRKTSDRINIGALMSIFIGNEGITFMSGTSNAYKKFNPKYAFYNEHIKGCFKENKEYCNFYGISGDIDPNSPYYSIYEIKKGFKPEIIELLGEFDLIINPIVYNLYKIALKGYKLLKRIKK